MARFDGDMEQSIMKDIDKLELNSDVVFGKMVNAGADAVLRNVRSNMRASFKSTRSLEVGLGKTKVYKTPSDGGVAVKVGFRGYSPYRKGTGRNKAYAGQPIPLIAVAREKGTRRGEARKAFLFKSFNKGTIEGEMKAVEPRLFDGVGA
jgi:hypothetical protein